MIKSMLNLTKIKRKKKAPKIGSKEMTKMRMDGRVMWTKRKKKQMWKKVPRRKKRTEANLKMTVSGFPKMRKRTDLGLMKHGKQTFLHVKR